MLFSYWTLGALKNSLLIITSVDSHVQHHNTVVRYAVCLSFLILICCLPPYYCICFSPTQLTKWFFSILTFQQGWGRSSLMFGFGWNKLKKAMFLFEFVSFKNQVVCRIPPPTCWSEGKLYNLEKAKDVTNEKRKCTTVVGADCH